MPSYDAEQQSYIVRIVYDGPGFAGKTTNLQQVCALLPATKRSELYTPAALKGRTMFFDWMEVKGPPVTSIPVSFHLITVPGQIERNYRRRPLVEMADVIVFVCDSTPEKMPESMRTFARLRGSIKQRGTPVPVIVQANKQDEPGALSIEGIRRKLKLGEEVPVVSARSVLGEGVRETLARAMRAGLQGLNAEVLDPNGFMAQQGQGAPRAPEQDINSADLLFEHILTFEDKPKNDEPVEVEELYIAAEEIDETDEALQMHLMARSLDDLESKAKRVAKQGQQVSELSEPFEADDDDLDMGLSEPLLSEPFAAEYPEGSGLESGISKRGSGLQARSPVDEVSQRAHRAARKRRKR